MDDKQTMVSNFNTSNNVDYHDPNHNNNQVNNIKTVDNLQYNLTKIAIVIIATLIAFIFLNPSTVNFVQTLLPYHIPAKKRRWYAFLILILVVFIIYRLILI